LNNQNYVSLLDYCIFGSSLNISEIYVTELKIYEGYETALSKYRLCRSSSVYKVLQKAKSILSDKGISSSSFNIDFLSQKNQCYLSNRASPIIDVDGTVAFCSGHEDVYIGNIQDTDIEDKWDTFAEQLGEKNVSWCKHCHDHMLPSGLYNLPKNIK